MYGMMLVKRVEFDGFCGCSPCLELWLRSGSKTELESGFDGNVFHRVRVAHGGAFVLGVHDVGQKMH